ncbi:hypothetical protein G3545_14200 [Starkeya sp. ORNL1]|uniref:phage regulatory CII family protein n=1 Tax=Starkeya sp. ORNL1 TaxID=2709380 RepID=UPI00146440D4|nr:phage regulatory CII family protein [Starkeya sp. ORNL1]QJP14695.1 hypothetical protein G3545_14200 [Starkeya sp. ORNL1]
MMKRANPGSAHDALVHLFEAIGRTHGANGAPTEGLPLAADFLGVTHWTLRKQIDPDQPSDLGFGRVAMLTRHFGCPDAAQHLALAAGGVFVPMPDGDAGKVATLSAEVMRETGEAIALLFADISEGSAGGAELTPAEAREAVKPLGEALAKVADLYALVAEIAGRRGRG